MDIKWHGGTNFTIRANGATAIFNPKKDGAKGDMIIKTQEGKGQDEGEVKVVDWPGEYEIAGIAMTAGRIPDANSMYITMNTGKLRVCMIESTGKKLDEELIDRIGDVDVLIIGVDADTMDAQTAHKVVEELEPRAVIPMNFKDAEPFLKLVGASGAQPQEKYSLKSRSELSEDKTHYVVLQPQG